MNSHMVGVWGLGGKIEVVASETKGISKSTDPLEACELLLSRQDALVMLRDYYAKCGNDHLTVAIAVISALGYWPRARRTGYCWSLENSSEYLCSDSDDLPQLFYDSLCKGEDQTPKGEQTYRLRSYSYAVDALDDLAMSIAYVRQCREEQEAVAADPAKSTL